MDLGLFDDAGVARRRHALLDALLRARPLIDADAIDADAQGAFPAGAIALLRSAGMMAAPVPAIHGGLGIGTDADAVAPTVAALRSIGQASLAVGRLLEGHVNALRLIFRFGDRLQAERAALDARAGHLFGVWNTDAGDDRLRIAGGVLAGAKILASGAGRVTRAMVTIGDGDRQLLLVDLAEGARADLSGWTAQGMRASATGRVAFDGIATRDVQWIGRPGDYLAQPDFSAGHWRVLAVQTGGLDALIEAWRRSLVDRDRDGDPHQRARFGTALVAQETAHLFVRRAASLAANQTAMADDVIAYVGLARTAVERACTDAIQLAQRSLGLAAFMRPAAVERICRDLATYLRQPVPDAVLDEAAAHFFHNDPHGLPADPAS